MNKTIVHKKKNKPHGTVCLDFREVFGTLIFQFSFNGKLYGQHVYHVFDEYNTNHLLETEIASIFFL